MTRRIAVWGGLFLLLAAGAPREALGQCPNNVPHATGTWRTLPYQMPINPISATLLHTGKVLIVAGSENDAANDASGDNVYRYAIWDPTGADQNSVVVGNIAYDVFCSGTAQMPHGRTLTVGGTNNYSFTGDKRASFFDPETQTFAQSQDMADGRWYGTLLELGDGRMMAFSGLGLGGGTNRTVQMFDLASAGTGWGATVTDPFTPPLFPRSHLLPNGKVFFSGHGSGGSISNGWIFDPSARSWTASAATTRDRQYGGSVLLPLLPPSYTPKVMAFGGGDPATATTEMIDLSASSPSWSSKRSMSTGRIELNSVLLPNGRVLLSGGSVHNETPDDAGKAADVYDPSNNSMTSGGTAAFSRLYHSTAVLLPDATVASLGSNPGARGKYVSSIEIYTPAYLYDANDHLISSGRPQITSVSATTLEYGAGFTVDYTSGSAISSAVLMRPGSTTHAFDMDQRLVGLCGPSPQPACSSSGTLSLTAPPNGNVAPPGYYMLFILDSDGVPSVARWVELTTFTSAPPTGSISQPPGDVTIDAGGTVFFDTTASASQYSWIFPGGSPATSTAKTPGSVTFSSPGMYTVSLTVIDGSNNTDASPPTRTITVRPSTSDFDVTVGAQWRSVAPGQSATYPVNVGAYAGFSSTVSLSADSEGGFPSGVSSGGFSPPTVSGSGSSTLTMDTTTGASPLATSVTVTGTSGSTSHKAATTLMVTLEPPSGLVATATDSQVALSWGASTGASSYRVARGFDAGGPYQTLDCTSSTAYTDTGLVNGTTYYYVVTANFTGGPNGGGSSADSNEAAATPPCPVPSYSGSLSAAKSGDQITWSWTAGGASWFDLVQGDLGTLRSSDGDFTQALDAIPAGDPVCLGNDMSALSLVDPAGAPAPGVGVFTILRPSAVSCPAAGTYDDGSLSEIASRDGGVSGSSRACP